MTDILKLFVRIGWDHIINPGAIDHMLFLMALTVNFRLKDFKKLVWLVSLFTLTHTASLVLSAYHILKVPSIYVEKGIMLTIIITALSNIMIKDKKKLESTHFLFAVLFGFVHGLGFTHAFMMSVSGMNNIWFPLLGFALGVEAGQVAVILVFLLIIHLTEKILRTSEKNLTQGLSFFILGYAVSLLKLF